jgi:Uncharacterised nucleotidyltransferase
LVAIDPMDAEQLALNAAVLTALNELEVPYVLGGGHAVNRHGGPWRNTKDLDVFIPPEDRQTVIDCLTEMGCADYYSVWPYDREWIYRGHKGNKIVDVIWQSANKTGVVDPTWRERAVPGEMAGVATWFASPEDLIWLKAFIVQRERCDWPDILNLITASEGRLGWRALLERFGPHWTLLQSILYLFDWTCPQHFDYVPTALRQELQRRTRARDRSLQSGDAEPGEGEEGCRWQLLDSRPWFVEAASEESRE